MKPSQSSVIFPEVSFWHFFRDDIIEDDTNAPVDNEEAEDEDTKEGILEGDMQTFVFSATLSKDLQRNLKKRYKPKGSKKHYKKEHVPASTLGKKAISMWV